MAMIVHSLVQGSAEWLKHRKTRRNASDAAAMLGESPYMKRTELMHAIHSGVMPETSEYQQAIYDSGHRFEAYARPLAEAIMGAEVFPVSGSLPDSLLSASFDGIDEDETEAFEHKSLNAILREVMQGDFTGADLPIYYRIQMEQQCMVSGVKRVLFMASDWRERRDAEPELIEERHVWYYPDPALRARIAGGWAVFEEELAAYVPPATKALIVAKAAVVLPVIDIEVSGKLVVRANFDAFKARFTEYLESIPRKPSTDQDFADCAAALTQLEKIEKKMGEIAEGTLERASAVNEVVKTAEALREQARNVRLATEKLVKARKTEIKGEIIAEGVKGFADYVTALNVRIGENLMPTTGLAPDFAEAIKGKRNFDSSRDAMTTALAEAKMNATEIADRIQVNLRLLSAQDAKHAHLFKQDRALIVLKAADDLKSLVTARISEFDEGERQRIADETKRIQEAAQFNAANGVIDRHVAMDKTLATATSGDIAAHIATLEATRFTDDVYGMHVEGLNDARDAMLTKYRAALDAKRADEVAADATPAPAAVAIEPSAPVTQSSGARMFGGSGFVASRRAAANQPIVSTAKVRLGALCDLLGFTLTADALSKLGFEPAGKEGVAKLYNVSDFAGIRDALIGRLNAITIAEVEAAAASERKRA